MTIVISRYVRYVLVPASLTVGHTVPIKARLEFDNGASDVWPAADLISSHPNVVAAVDRRYVKGLAPGTATITGSAEGLTASVVLTVNP